MTVAIGNMVKKTKDKETPVFDMFGRVVKKLFPKGKDVCEVCDEILKNRNNDRQIIRFCSRGHRRLRHVGLEGGKV